MAAYLSVELPMSLDRVPKRPSASSKHRTASVALASWNRASMFFGVSPTHLDTSPAQFTICATPECVSDNPSGQEAAVATINMRDRISPNTV